MSHWFVFILFASLFVLPGHRHKHRWRAGRLHRGPSHQRRLKRFKERGVQEKRGRAQMRLWVPKLAISCQQLPKDSSIYDERRWEFLIPPLHSDYYVFDLLLWWFQCRDGGVLFLFRPVVWCLRQWLALQPVFLFVFFLKSLSTTWWSYIFSMLIYV